MWQPRDMSVFLFHGSDDVLVSEAVSDKVRELVGDQDRSLMLEEFDGEYVMAAVTEAANTPPFLGESLAAAEPHGWLRRSKPRSSQPLA